jgi:hypothetical protein
MMLIKYMIAVYANGLRIIRIVFRKNAGDIFTSFKLNFLPCYNNALLLRTK